MADSTQPQRLSQMQTLWSVVCHACGDGTTTADRSAQEQLLARYHKVVYRYLLGALRDPDAADELSQEFALRFVQGSLRGADPRRGRFRDFLKGVLYHLIGDYHRRRKKQALPLASGNDPPDPAADSAPSDAALVESWRSELLSRAWKSLAELEQQTGQPFHTVLRHRAEHADARSEQMATELALELGRPLTAAGVRQTLHRARERFAELLIDEVCHTLANPTLAELEEELIDVGLIEYCRPALDKLGESGLAPASG